MQNYVDQTQEKTIVRNSYGQYITPKNDKQHLNKQVIWQKWHLSGWTDPNKTSLTAEYFSTLTKSHQWANYYGEVNQLELTFISFCYLTELEERLKYLSTNTHKCTCRYALCVQWRERSQNVTLGTVWVF